MFKFLSFFYYKSPVTTIDTPATTIVSDGHNINKEIVNDKNKDVVENIVESEVKQNQIKILCESLDEFGNQMEIIKREYRSISNQLQHERDNIKEILKEKDESESLLSDEIDDLQTKLQNERKEFTEYKLKMESRERDVDIIVAERALFLNQIDQLRNKIESLIIENKNKEKKIEDLYSIVDGQNETIEQLSIKLVEYLGTDNAGQQLILNQNINFVK